MRKSVQTVRVLGCMGWGLWSEGPSCQPAEGKYSGGARPLLLSGLAKAVSERSEPAFAAAQTSGQARRPSVQTVCYEILEFVGLGFCINKADI